MTTKLRHQIERILAGTDDMTIATLRPDGWPQATTVSFVNEGLTTWFGTGAHSQKAQNIARDPRVSLTVNRPYDDWSAIEGLSLAGLAEKVADAAEIARIEALMIRKFPGLSSFAMPSSALAFIRIAPKIVSVLDYKKAFGHTETLTL